MVNLDEMLEKVKTRISVEGEENDPILRLMLADAVQAVTLFCNRTVFPPPLEYVARQMVANAYYRDNGNNVASIKRGDTQINYTSTITANDMTEEQRDMCCKFRRLRTL